MPRRPSLRLHKASGLAVVTIRGRDYYLGPYNSPSGGIHPDAKRKYQRLIAEYEGRNRSAAFGRSADEITVVELLSAFVADAKQKYGLDPSSELHRYRPIIRLVRQLYRDVRASQFGPTQYKAVRQHLLEKGTLSRRYINRQMRRVVSIWKWAAAEELVKPIAYRKLQLVEPLRAGRSTAKELEPVGPVNDELVDRTLPHLSRIVRAMVEFQRLTGCRPGEVCSITPAVVDRASEIWEIRLAKHKTAWRGKSRTIYVGRKAQQVLVPFLDRDPQQHCFSPAEAVEEQRAARRRERKTPKSCGNSKGTNRVVRLKREPGQAYNTGSYGNAIRKACKRAKLPHWSPNQLRHSAATTIRRGYGLEAASVTLGHSQLSDTDLRRRIAA